MSGAPARPRGRPATVCESRGQGRILQCYNAPPDGPWPAHIAAIPEFEQRCTACDDLKVRMGVLERVKADWERLYGPEGRPTGAAPAKG